MITTRMSAIAASIALTAGVAQAQDDVMVVFDGSNSMWGQIAGVSKVEIARDAMGRLLGDWATQTNVGLMAYGHRTKGDCRDIETIIPVGPFDRDAFLARVNRIVPTGKTPLTTAVEEAARQLSYRDTPATVVLISDGIESCDRDPCALAEELERTGVSFTAHVVGFGLATAEEQAALACIADKTGGEFIAAGDAEELEEALGRVSVAVAEQPAPPPEPELEPLFSVELTAPDTVNVGTDFDVAWSDMQGARDRVTIVPADAKESKIGNHIRTRDSLEGTLIAPGDAGLYEIRYILASNGSIAGRRMIEVAPAQITLEAPEAVVAGETFPIAWSGDTSARDFLTIVPVGTPDGKIGNHIRVRENTQGELRAPAEPGLYELRYVLEEGRGTIAIAMVEVTEPSVTVTAPETVWSGAAFDVSWSTIINDRDFVAIVPAGTPEGKVGNHIRVRDRTAGELRAPAEPGLYEVRYILDEGRRTLAVAMVEITEPNVSISAPETVASGAGFTVNWTIVVNGRDFVTVVPAGTPAGKIGNHVRVRDKLKGELRAPAEPGLYEVRYVLDEGRVTLAVAMLEVATPEVALTAPETAVAGSVFNVAWGSAINSRDFVTVVPVGTAEGKLQNHIRVREKRSGVLTAPTAPGLYEVRYVLDEGRKTLATSSLEIVEPDISVSATPTVRAGGYVEVTWTGQAPNGRDFVTIVPVGTPEGKLLTHKRVRDGGGVKLKAPDAPGLYEARYVLDEGRRTLSVAAVEVVDASAPINDGALLAVPESAAPGSSVDVSWSTSSTSTRLRLSLAKTGQADFTWIEAKPVGAATSLTFTMPDEPGAYEFRLLDLSGPSVLSRAVIQLR